MDLSGLQGYWEAAWPVVTAVVAVASSLDAVLPQPSASSHWLPVRKVISFLAVNVKNASNGAQPPISTWVMRIIIPVIEANGYKKVDAVVGVQSTPVVDPSVNKSISSM